MGIVVLAAGGSTRLGTPKQLLTYQGRTLLRRAVETALEAAAGPVAVVLGAEAARMRAELAGLDVRVAENPDWAEGLSTSLHSGLAALDAPAAAGSAVDAALFTTCDQPLVTSALLREIIGAYDVSHPAIVVCEYAGTVGVPALFSRALFPELLALRGDAGAKRVIARHLPAVARVPFPDAVLDIDTAADVLRQF